MRTVLDRFLDYIGFDTQSNDSTGTHPSTPGQFELARHLAEELEAIGAEKVRVSEHACVTACLPATPGLEQIPPLGLIAHLDTSDAASGREIHPQIVKYTGGTIPLGKSGKTLDPARFPFLNRLTGHTLITTDGTTLLGADDKAGIAEIMTAAEQILTRNLPHGTLCIGFTPDEEIGEGTLCFDVAAFGAAYAYTLDGGAAGEIEYRNFNAAEAEVKIRGVNVHPGSAKGIMVNAQKVAFAFDAMLPAAEMPEATDGLEGFYHLARTSGTVGEAQLTYLLRDHDAEKFAARKEKLREIAAQQNRQYGEGTVTVTCRDQYRNMEEVIARHPQLLEIARRAVREAGLVPSEPPIRGGTDGAQLSFRGLPCPNLSTGGYCYHGVNEFVPVSSLVKMTDVLQELVARFA